jgi:hypothetical protein
MWIWEMVNREKERFCKKVLRITHKCSKQGRRRAWKKRQKRDYTQFNSKILH